MIIDNTITNALTGPEKACIMMITMGEVRSQKVLKKLKFLTMVHVR